jgi:uncharacterized protein involved in propanediol utilization
MKDKIPQSATNLLQGSIPQYVTQLKNQDEFYFLSFNHYNEKVCEIKLLQKNCPKECILVLKRISQSRIGSLKENNIDKFEISNCGDYQKLYNNLTKDVQIFEHKIQGESRLFYFIAASKFYVVAITNNHLETGKIRR